MPLTAKERISYYIVDPMNRYKIAWDFMMGVIFLLSYIIDPVVFAFAFEPLENPAVNFFSSSITFVIIIDMFLNLFTGIPKEDDLVVTKSKKQFKRMHANRSNEGLDDPVLQRDIVIIMKNYLFGDCFIDIMANIPIITYFVINGFEKSESNGFTWCMGLKTLRLFHADEVLDVLKRIMDILSNIFYLHRYLFSNLYTWIVAGMKFLLFIHYYACFWVYVVYLKKEAGLPHVEFVNDTMLGQYVDSFYLMTTTITTVGYGDYKGFVDTDGGWLVEMIYLYIVTLSGIALFSSVTNQIFSYKKLLTVREIVKEKVTEIEEFLTEVS